jgi:hypothetical protein
MPKVQQGRLSRLPLQLCVAVSVAMLLLHRHMHCCGVSTGGHPIG